MYRMTSQVQAPARSIPLIESVVDHRALAHNLEVVKRVARTPVMAVVKADAFGHGAVEVASTFLAGGADQLGVATIDEALALRAAGITAPVLAWLVDQHSPIGQAVRQQVTVSCSDLATLAAVARAAGRTGRRALVHLELDTGMRRGGATDSEWPALCRAARAFSERGYIEVEGIWSHLASASRSGHESVQPQRRELVAGVRVARRAGVTPRLLHLANSAAAFIHPECRFSLVRVAAALYGIETVVGATFGLRSAIRVTSRVLHVRRVPAGSAVGYDGGHRTPHRTSLALVPVGYGDGVPRSLSNGGSVSIRGWRHPIVGSISMDQLVVDVGDRHVVAGDEVVLLGSADAGEPQPREWADLTGTVPHEILTGLGGRIARTHVGAC